MHHVPLSPASKQTKAKKVTRIVYTDNSKVATDRADVLLAKINVAVKAANEAETELVSRSKAVGLLLLEAKELHPKVKDFEAFLKRVDGLHLSRAYDLLRLAGGRTTDEELREEARERKRKSRAKPKPKTLPKPAKPTPEPEKEFRDVTESAEESGERRRLCTRRRKRRTPQRPRPTFASSSTPADCISRS